MNRLLGLLGKPPPQPDDRTLRLSRYLAAPNGTDLDELRPDLARL